MTQLSYHTLTFCNQWCLRIQVASILSEAIVPGIPVKCVPHGKSFPAAEEEKLIHCPECCCEITLVLWAVFLLSGIYSSESDIDDLHKYVGASSWKGVHQALHLLEPTCDSASWLVFGCLKLCVWHVSSQSEGRWSTWRSLTTISQIWFTKCRSAIAGIAKLFL